MKLPLQLLASFFCGGLVTGLAIGTISILVFEQFDPKFRDTPGVALQLELVGALATVFIGTALLAVAVGIQQYLRKNNPIRLRRPILTGAVVGAVYPAVLWLVLTLLEAQLSQDSWVIPAVGWMYLLVYPVAFLAVTIRYQAVESP